MIAREDPNVTYVADAAGTSRFRSSRQSSTVGVLAGV
jgi:hypothetical protein